MTLGKKNSELEKENALIKSLHQKIEIEKEAQ